MATKKNEPEMLESNIEVLLKKGPKSNKEMREALGLSTEHYDAHLDRALQKMRKDGKLKLLNGRWVVGHTQVCDKCGGKGWVKS
jgi:hypothetical protein